jgi:nitronate monooxygenase
VGTSALYRQALLDARFPDTILTRAYSDALPEGWQTGSRSSTTGTHRRRTPEVHHLTRPLRASSTKAGDASVPNRWADTGWLQVTADPAATIVRRIATETR